MFPRDSGTRVCVCVPWRQGTGMGTGTGCRRCVKGRRATMYMKFEQAKRRMWREKGGTRETRMARSPGIRGDACILHGGSRRHARARGGGSESHKRPIP